MAWMSNRNQLFLPGGGLSESASFTLPGMTVGVGGEWMFAPNWSVKAEGMYYDLGRVSYALTPAAVTAIGAPAVVTGSAAARFSNRVDGVIARVGVNYHFGGPVVARY